MNRSLSPSLALFALLSVTSCGSLRDKEPEPLWQEMQVEAPSDRVLWKLALLSVEKVGFPLAGGLDPSSGVITSGWRTNLQPFQGEGYRMRAEVRLSPTGPGRWAVGARVKKQINDALVAPLDPTRAEWEWAPDDPLVARVLLQHIRSYLDPEIEIGEESPEDPVEALLRK